LPLAVLAAAAMLVSESRQRAAKRPDLLGAGILVGALVAIVYPLLEGRRLGWPAWGWALLALGVLAIVVLGIVDARRRHGAVAPLLPTRLFRYPAFAAGVLVQLIFFGTMLGFVLTLTLWLQAGQGFSPMHAGLTTIAFSVGAPLTAGVSIGLAPRFGRYVLVAGAVLMAAGTVGCDVAAHHAGEQVTSCGYVLCALLSLALPSTAVEEAY
jgi:hypothetical protein